MTNHLWHGCLIASPWAINPCEAWLGCCPLSKPQCQWTAEVNNSQSIAHSLHCSQRSPFFFPPVHLAVLGRRHAVTSLFLGVGYKGKQKAGRGYWGEGWQALRYCSCSAPQATTLYLCLPSHHFLPSLTVPRPSASCRFLIKEKISLMPPQREAPPLILSSPLTPSSSVFSFISPPLPCEATWLTSIS